MLRGERRVQHHTHRHDDIATILRLKREFGFDVVLQHGTETWMLADELAAAGIGVSFTLVDSPGRQGRDPADADGRAGAT